MHLKNSFIHAYQAGPLSWSVVQESERNSQNGKMGPAHTSRIIIWF